MTAAMAFWWRARTLREQRLLLALLAVASALAAWLGVVRPLTGAEAHARARYEIALDTLAEARAQAAAVDRLQRQPPPRLGAPLAEVIAQGAADAGFAGSRVNPSGPGRAAIAIDAARPEALFAWLDELQARGLVVERLRAAANSDRTLAFEAVLRARGR